MPVEYGSFLELASESLEEQKSREADLRNCISKSYYFMYHSAFRLTNGKVGKIDSEGNAFAGGVHKKFYSYLSDNAAEKHGLNKAQTVKVGLLLKQNHALRITADYNLSQTLNRPTAEMAIQRSIDTDRLIEQLLETRQ
ncbi:hypothetical protein [Pectobacterium aroidearum]|uniref:hypothetical protein n=1 Tax=Pectobacterium aroidearum TaxID=1201031 RepID=UPI002A7EF30E|nr:hypothetical protein [Pectobacterium aroidearum]MDY4387904.1 hypothetical protein [Pectobacterium aroidearum]